MLKTMKKAMCRILVFAMILTVVSVPAVSTVGASEESNVIWTQQDYMTFDGLSELADTSYSAYQTSSAALEADPTGGQYLKMTKSSEEDVFGMKVLFPKSNTANFVKLEYNVKIVDAEGSWWPISEKITPTGATRAWSLRLADGARYQIQTSDKTDIAALTNKNGWFTVTHEYNNSTKTITTTFTNPDGVTKSGTKTFANATGGFDAYWLGCQSGGVVAYDNIKVSYGYNKPEDLTIDFEGLEADSAFTHDKVFMQNTTATVNKNDTDGTFLRMSCTDSASTTKNSVQIKAFEGFSLAKNVTLEYKVRIPECASCPGTEGTTNDTFSKHPGLNTKFKGFKENGTTTANAWAARVCHYKAQANSDARRDTVNVGSDWFTVKHVIDNTITTNNLTTTITAKDGTSHTNTATYVPATIAYYELVVTDIAIINYLDVDDIKVTYAYDEEVKAPEATVKVYADGEVQSDLANASMLTDKVVVSFSEEMDDETVNENTVYVENAKGEKVICGAELDSAKKNYTLTFPSLLASGTYAVVVTDGAKSALEAAAVPARVEFTVSSETPELPQQGYTQNFILNFDDIETGAASNIDGVIKYNSGVGAKIVEGGVTGNCLSVVPKSAVSEADPIGAASKWSVFFNKIDTNTNADQVKIEYEVKLLDTETKSSATYGGLYAADKEYSVKTGTTRAWANRIGTDKVDLMEDKANGMVNIGSAIENLNDWVKVTYVYDKASNTMTGSYSQNGVTINSGVRDMTKRGMVRAFILGSNSGTGEEIYLDNFAVTYIYNEPTVSADSITVADVQGADQDNWNIIDPLTKSIKVDFGAVMDTATLNNTNIYLSKDGGTTKVPYIPSYENGVYTMSFTENLEKSTKYTLYIAKAVANVTGVTLDDAVSYDITTGKGVRKAELVAIKLNDTKVTSVADLKNATKAKVEVDWANTTGEDQKLNLIIAFYAGDRLKAVELVEPTIKGDVITMAYSYEFNLPADMTEVTGLKVMSWSTFGEMIPLSDHIAL